MPIYCNNYDINIYQGQSYFLDLDYTDINDEDRDFVRHYLKKDYPVYQLAQQQLDAALEKTYYSKEDGQSTLRGFQERCSRRYHNFHPPRAAGEPMPEFAKNADDPSASSSNRNRADKKN